MNAVNSMHYVRIELIPCSVKNGTLLNAVDSMQHDGMQWILCSMAQSIPIECSGFHAASLNAEDSMHCGVMDPDCMQWSRCSEAQSIPIECSGVRKRVVYGKSVVLGGRSVIK